MKLSIVVPSLNQGRYIDATLRSLVEQKSVRRGELEIIVIDGGSSDETINVIGRFGHRLDYWVSEPDGGQTDALIKGFERASGDVLGWLCADDLLEPWTVREVLDHFHSNAAAEFIYGDAVWIDRDGSFHRSKKEIPFNWFIWLHDHNYIPQPAAFWRRSLYDRAGCLNPRFDLAMDGDLFARFAGITRPVHVARRWARLRSYPEQRNRRLRSISDQEDREIRERLGVSFDNRFAVKARYCAAKTWRVAWKLALRAYP